MSQSSKGTFAAGVTIVAAQWIVRFGLPLVWPDGSMSKFFIPNPPLTPVCAAP
jgi:hypothetical protein